MRLSRGRKKAGGTRLPKDWGGVGGKNLLTKKVQWFILQTKGRDRTTGVKEEEILLGEFESTKSTALKTLTFETSNYRG